MTFLSAEKRLRPSNIINDMFFVAIICLQVMNEMFTGILGVAFGISFPLIGLFLVYTLLFNRLNISTHHATITAVVVFAFIISFLRIGFNDTIESYLLIYAYYGLIPLLFINTKHDGTRIIRIISYVGVFAVLYYLIIGVDTPDSLVYMNSSNILLPCGLAIMNQAFFRKKQKNFTKLFFVLAFIAYASLMFSWGTRGALLSICMYPLINLLSRVSGFKRTIITSLSIAFSYLIFMNLEYILIWVSNFLYSVGIEPGLWLNKTIALLARDNLSNGRLDVWGPALKTTVDNAVFGSGISGLETQCNFYAHNVFLQIVVEYGVFVGLALVIGLIYLIVKTIVYKGDQKRKEYIIFLMASSLVVLMFTSVYWAFVAFWLFIYEAINLIKKKAGVLEDNVVKSHDSSNDKTLKLNACKETHK